MARPTKDVPPRTKIRTTRTYRRASGGLTRSGVFARDMLAAPRDRALRATSA
jgi:hypothetical protein